MERKPYERVGVIRDPEGRAWWRAEQENRCQICLGKPDWRGFSIHHCVRGAGRSDEACNFLLVCGPCHDRCPGHDGGEYPKLTLGQILTCKVLSNPTEYDRPRLEALYGSPLAVEPLPDWLLELRAKNTGRKFKGSAG